MKPKAEDRTIDLFSGKTRQEEVSTEDAVEAHKTPETVEEQAERLREKAFETAEHLSKHWGQAIDGGTYRLTTRGQFMLLEQFKHNGHPAAYGYTGVMFPISDLYELTGVLVKAAKEKKAKERQ